MRRLDPTKATDWSVLDESDADDQELTDILLGEHQPKVKKSDDGGQLGVGFRHRDLVEGD